MIILENISDYIISLELMSLDFLGPLAAPPLIHRIWSPSQVGLLTLFQECLVNVAMVFQEGFKGVS